MGTVSQASLNMKAFVIVALVAAVAGEADPYTIGQVLAGQTNGGVLTSTTYHGGVKVEGFPYTKAVLPAVTYAGWPYAHAGVLYGKREAEAEPKADPALVYSTGLVGAYPYAVGAHAVTYTPFGVTHSSNVGICTNNLGAVVPCRRKREADPALVYSTVGAVPYTYGVLPYAGVHGTNPVHAVAHTAAGLTHSSNVGICTNYVGAVVPC